MTSKERILKTIKGEMPDRVPISTYEMVAYNYWPETENGKAASYEVLGFDYKSWHHRQSSYRDLLEFVKNHTDCFYIWFPDETGGLGKVLTGAEVERQIKTRREGSSVYSSIVIETPKGPLSMKTRVDDNVNTV